MQDTNATQIQTSTDVDEQATAPPLAASETTEDSSEQLHPGNGYTSKTELEDLQQREESQHERRVSRHDPDPADWEIMRRMVTLDKTLTSPGRLAVLAALWRAGDLDYIYLQNLAGSSQGNLATHCRKLEDAGLIESRKTFIHRRANTRLFITDAGRDTISGYVEGLRSLMEQVQSWQPAIDDYREFYKEGENDRPAANPEA